MAHGRAARWCGWERRESLHRCHSRTFGGGASQPSGILHAGLEVGRRDVRRVRGSAAMRRQGLLEGPRLVLWAAVIATTIGATSLVATGVAEAGLRAAIRATARTSLVLFVLAFVASSINSLWRGPRGKWLLRNRKFLGNGLAASQGVHALFIGWLWALVGDRLLRSIDPTSLYGGLFGYALLLAMVVTSFPGPARWLGRRRWVVLHKLGMYAIFGIFVFSYLGSALAGRPVGVVAVVVLLVAQALRFAAWWHRRRRLGV
jgi:sulfoxide reductase heme-binding subunit YedZ